MVVLRRSEEEDPSVPLTLSNIGQTRSSFFPYNPFAQSCALWKGTKDSRGYCVGSAMPELSVSSQASESSRTPDSATLGGESIWAEWHARHPGRILLLTILSGLSMIAGDGLCPAHQYVHFCPGRITMPHKILNLLGTAQYTVPPAVKDR